MPALTRQTLNLHLAADPRAAQTDYTDDQAWDVALGKTAEEPALSIQTRYGGRVGLARIVPLLRVNGKLAYTVGELKDELHLISLGNDAVTVEARPWSGSLEVGMVIWVIDSHTLGGHFRLSNRSNKPMTVEVELYFQGMSQDKELAVHQLHLSTPRGGAIGLGLQDVPNLKPVLLLEKGLGSDSAKLSSTVEILPAQESTLRFVQGAYPNQDDSVLTAYTWLHERKWSDYLAGVNERIQALPSFDFADNNLDAAIALSQLAVLRSWMGKTEHMPHASPVFIRTPATGFAPVGAEHPWRAWAGVTGLETFQLAASTAVLDPALAQGIVRNYLAHQDTDGFIDGSLGAGGQKGGYLLLPMLAHLTEIIYGYSQDKVFVKDVFPGLVKFYARWMNQDTDRDGFPEWHSIQEANYEYHPLASMTTHGSIPTAIRLLECPDLAAYLLREGEALTTLAGLLGEKARALWNKAAKYHTRLSQSLQKSWRNDRFYYRDRDTDALFKGEQLYKAKGDDTTAPASFKFKEPNRLVIITDSSSTHRPTNLSAIIQGFDVHGQAVTETIASDEFTWYRTRCAATTQAVWQQVEKIQVLGLSRVYEYEVRTLDLSRHDISLNLPYMTKALSDEQRNSLFADLQASYWQSYGLASLPRNDPAYSRNNSHALQVVMPWSSLLGVAMLRHHEVVMSGKLFLDTAQAIIKSLLEQGAFFQWYDAETGAGLGMTDSVTGAISLHWLVQLVGVIVRDGGTVEILGDYGLGKKTLKLTWQGVRITRNDHSLKIKFPSGHSVDLGTNSTPQVIRDPQYHPPQKKLPPFAASVVNPIKRPVPPKTVKVRLKPDDQP